MISWNTDEGATEADGTASAPVGHSVATPLVPESNKTTGEVFYIYMNNDMLMVNVYTPSGISLFIEVLPLITLLLLVFGLWS